MVRLQKKVIYAKFVPIKIRLIKLLEVDVIQRQTYFGRELLARQIIMMTMKIFEP